MKKDLPALSEPFVPTTIEERVKLLACGDSCVLVQEGDRLFVIEQLEEGYRSHTLGPSPIQSGLFAIDDRNVVCAGGLPGDGPFQLHFFRRDGEGWGSPSEVGVEGAPSALLSSIAVGGDFMALGWSGTRQTSKRAAQPGVFEVLRFEGSWAHDVRFEEDESKETSFGAHAAFDVSADCTRMALSSWDSPRIFDREGDEWKRVDLTYQKRHSGDSIRSIDIRGDIVVLGCEKSSNHVDEFGWVTGRERTDSGSLLVFERAGDVYGSPALLKGSNKQQSGGVFFENLGSKVVAGDGWVIGAAWQRKAEKPTYTAFARDTENGSWTQRLSEEEPNNNSDTRGYTHALVAHIVESPKNSGSGTLQIRKVLPGMSTAVAPALPCLPPMRVAVEGESVPKELSGMGTGIVQVGEGKYASLCWSLSGFKLALFDEREAKLIELMDKATSPAPELVRCGNDVLIRHKSTLQLLRDDTLETIQHPLEASHRVFGGEWGMMIINDVTASLFGPDRSLITTAVVTKGVECVASDAKGWVLGAPNRGVYVYDEKLQLKAELKPKKAAKQFGASVTLDGEAIVVGSGAGAHVFEPVDDGYVETLIKLTRSKKAPDRFVVISGNTMAVACQPMNKELGAVVVFARDAKKKWKKRFSLSDCNSKASALIDGERLLIGRPLATAPIQIYNLS